MAEAKATSQREEAFRTHLAESQARARQSRISEQPSAGNNNQSGNTRTSRASNSSLTTNVTALNDVRLSLAQNQQRTISPDSQITSKVTKVARKMVLRFVIMGLLWLGGLLFLPLVLGGGALLTIYAVLH